MQSKKFSSNFSIPLIKENMKRFWGLSFLSFLSYFLLGVLPVILSPTAPNYFFMNSMLKGEYFPYVFILLATPILLGLLIYRYLQQPSSAAIMNAFPFSRKTMFHSNFISGILLCLLPILLTGILLLICSEPAVHTFTDQNGILITLNAFTKTAVLKWVLIYVVITLMLYSIIMFSATVTGSSLLQFLFSIGFLFLIPAILLSLESFCQLLLDGYTTWPFLTKFACYVCPVLGIHQNLIYEGKLQYGFLLSYLFIFLFLYIATYFLFKNRKMEKASDSVIFNSLKPIFKYLISFLGMTVIGWLFYSISNYSIGFFYLGIILGSLISYILTDMIIQKSLRIKGFIKGFGCYTLIMLVFFSCFIFDLFGYEKSIPDLSQISSALLESSFSSEYFSSEYHDMSDAEITNEYTIQEILAVHKALIETDMKMKHGQYFETPSERITISYTLNNGNKIKRSYHIFSHFFDDESSHAHMKALYESEEYKKYLYPLIDEKKDTSLPYFILFSPLYSYEWFGNYPVSLTNPEEINEFLQIFKEDLKNETFEESRLYLPEISEISLESYHPRNKKEICHDWYTLKPYHENTINWLKAKDYYDKLAILAADVSHLTIHAPVEIDLETRSLYDQFTGYSVEIANPEEIQLILDHAYSYLPGSDIPAYEVRVYPAQNSYPDYHITLYLIDDAIPELVHEYFALY